MAKILCIEDSSEFSLYLTSVLKDHSVTVATDLKQALQITQNETRQFDLILLDISLPDGNGLKLLPQLRQSPGMSSVPIIVLSSDSDVITKVAAFGVGADDYVAKPPDASELRARIEARLRSRKTQDRNKSRLQVGNLIVDTDTMRAEVHTQKGIEILDLTPSEFKILRMIASHPDLVYSRDQVIDQVWGIGKHVTPRTVDAHVSNLRKKMVHSTLQIETVTGSGYRGIIRGSAAGTDNSN